MATTNRGFTLHHQRVVVEIDLSGRLRGYTELTLVPTTPDLRTVFLHARDVSILSIRHPAAGNSSQSNCTLDFSHNLPPAPTVSDPSNVRLFPEAKRKVYEAINLADEGELAVAIDRSRLRKHVRSSQTPRPDGQTTTTKDKEREPEFEPFMLIIEYEITTAGGGEGICVVGPTDDEPLRIPHIFTNNSTPTAARSWVPCVDSLWERCTWDFEFITPRALVAGHNPAGRDVDDGGDKTGDRDDDVVPVVVVASGELVEQVMHPHTSTKTIFHYSQPVATSVQHIAWACGPFKIQNLSPGRSDSGDESDNEATNNQHTRETNQQQLSVHAFCLPGMMDDTLNSTGFARKAAEFYTSEYGSYPFSSYKMVFVDTLASHTCAGSIFNAATITIFPLDLLHPPEVIDQAYETRPLIAQALSAQWAGINIVPKTWSDVWLINGLSYYISGLFLKSLWGNNEYRFRLKKDSQRCVALDVKMAPLCQPGIPTAPDADYMPFLNLKAPLVLHMLDRHLRKSGISLGLSRVIPKLFLSAISGELRDNTLSTSAFLRLCRKVSGGGDLRGWAEQWIYCGGCPHFNVEAHFNRKKMAVELQIRQESQAQWYFLNQASDEERVVLKPCMLFEGQMTIRIHEADGTPYEHVLDIREAFKRHDLPFNTKYKRVRRNTKRFQARQAAAAAAAQGDVDAEEDLGMMDMSFGYGAWEELKERERWRVEDWSEEDDQVMSQATYEWCRIDAEFEWVCTTKFDQPDFMWLEQLQRDRDVVAQIEAIQALSHIPSPIVSSQLCKTVLVTNYFFRVRMEAALALIACGTAKLDYIGIFHLLKLYQTRYCFEPTVETMDPSQIRCIPLPNDFSDLAEYFVRKALLMAISQLRNNVGQSFPYIQKLFVDQFCYHDNARNPYTDTYYLTTLINATSNCFVNVAEKDKSQLVRCEDIHVSNPNLESVKTELERCLNIDRLVPSFHNGVTIAIIECKLKMTLAALIPVDYIFFLALTREGNYASIRMAAFDAILLLKGFQEKSICRYMFIVLRDDESLSVKRRLASGIVQCLPVLVAMEELGHDKEEGGVVEVEEGSRKVDRGLVDHKTVFKNIRHEVGRALILRESLSAVMLYNDVDPDVQACLLKLSEILFKPMDESVPKIRLRMPATTTAYQPELESLVVPVPTKVKLSIGTTTHSGADSVPPRSARIVIKETSEVPFKLTSPLKSVTIVNPASTSKLIKLPKPAKKQKFQTSGMEMTDYKACQKLLKKIIGIPTSQPFRVPVDPVRDGAPDYWNVIQTPMDLSTMSQKLESGMYSNRHDLLVDFNLMVDNCKVYNRQDSPMVTKFIDPLVKTWSKLWERSEHTIASFKDKAEAAKERMVQLVKSTTATESVAAVPKVHRPAPSFADFAKAATAPPTSTPLPEPHRGNSIKLTLKTKVTTDPVPTPPPPPSARPGLKLKFSTGASVVAPIEQNVEPVEWPNDILTAPKRDKEEDVVVVKAEKKGKKKKEKGVVVADAKPIQATAVSEGSEDAPLATVTTFLDPEEFLQAGSSDAVNVKKGKTILRKVYELQASTWFRSAVDPILQGVPTYYDEIAHPMDLGTMRDKWDKNVYKKQSDVEHDFNLVVRNCVKFNGVQSEASQAAAEMARQWRSEWEKASRIGYAEKRGLLSVIQHMFKVPGCDIFAEAVDPVALQIPTYFDVIGGRDKARDLGSIRQRLNGDGYVRVDEVEDDVRQMLANCSAFNPADSPVAAVGIDVGRVFEAGVAKVRREAGWAPLQSGKRKGSEGGGGSGSGKKGKYA